MNNKKYDEGVQAIQTVMSLNEDLLLRDINGNFLTADMVYDKYWSGINKKTLFNTLVKQVGAKHEIMRSEDDKKKQMFQLLLEQPDVDHLGYDTKFVLSQDAPQILRDIMIEEGQDQINVIDKEFEPGFLCRHNNVNIYVVDQVKDYLTIQDWQQADSDLTGEYELGEEEEATIIED